MDPYRLVFDKLYSAGVPDTEARERVYAECRAQVAAAYADPILRERALGDLEKVIRRNEVQALYEERLDDH